MENSLSTRLMCSGMPSTRFHNENLLSSMSSYTFRSFFNLFFSGGQNGHLTDLFRMSVDSNLGTCTALKVEANACGCCLYVGLMHCYFYKHMNNH